MAQHGMRDAQGGGEIAKVTVSGIGLRSHTHVATLLFEELACSAINVEMIGTSELQVSAVINAKHATAAKTGLEKVFAASLSDDTRSGDERRGGNGERRADQRRDG